MEYWIILDGERLGPMSAVEVGRLAVTKDTPVWREGLADWSTLGAMPEFEPFFHSRDRSDPAADVADPMPDDVADPMGAASAPSDMAEQAPVNTAPEPRNAADCPATRLGWSIAATLLCCAPLGVAGIFFSSKVSSAWYEGDMDKALRMQERAEWCIIGAIVLGLLTMPLQMIIALI